MKRKILVAVSILCLSVAALASPGAPAPIVNCIDNPRCILGLGPYPTPPVPNPPVPGQNIVISVIRTILGI